jgi:hypothetical protein
VSKDAAGLVAFLAGIFYRLNAKSSDNLPSYCQSETDWVEAGSEIIASGYDEFTSELMGFSQAGRRGFESHRPLCHKSLSSNGLRSFAMTQGRDLIST